MKVEDLTLGATNISTRDTKDIYEETRQFFRQEIPSLDLSERELQRTPFFISVKVIEGLPLFELYYAEELFLITLCSCDSSHREKAIDYMKELAEKLDLSDRFREPKGQKFLFTAIVNPLVPASVTMLAGEIGFYIYFRIRELYEETK